MKVAIMGAGLAGLSCAAVLERHGIEPELFENRAQVGDRFVNGEIILSVLSRPERDVISLLSECYGIFLHPLAHIGRLSVFSENETASIDGRLGFCTLRGREADSLEKQLARQVRARIHFHSKKAYEDLLEEYTHVVLATGDGGYAQKLKNYRLDLTVSLKGASVEGSFDRYTVAAWLDNRFAPGGYGYFIPYSEKEANLVIAMPDSPDNLDLNRDELWEHFLRKASRDLGQEPVITDRFQITGYKIGLCRHPRIGNTFFAGNCFGAIMPFLGFGQYPAILTGIYAALDLCGEGNYEELTRHLRESYEHALTLRNAMGGMDNAGFDLLVRALETGLAEKLFNSRLNFLKAAGIILKPFFNLPEQQPQTGNNEKQTHETV